MQGPSESRWNLHDNGNFYVDSIYKALIQQDMPVDKKNLEDEWLLKTKIFAWYLHPGVILTKDNVAKCKWHGSKKNVYSFTMKRLSYICSSTANLRDLYSQLFKLILPYSHHATLETYLAIG
jgi:hypothetical protein